AAFDAPIAALPAPVAAFPAPVTAADVPIEEVIAPLDVAGDVVLDVVAFARPPSWPPLALSPPPPPLSAYAAALASARAASTAVIREFNMALASLALGTSKCGALNQGGPRVHASV